MGNICVKPSFPTKKNLKECIVKSIEDDDIPVLVDLIAKCVLTGPRDSERLRLDEPVMFKHTVNYS
jgi:hypothetical protein